jgi:hypothetical protein
MFQVATPASNNPALRPTRGSGLGAATDIMLPIGVGPMLVAVVAVERAHAPAEQIASASAPACK